VHGARRKQLYPIIGGSMIALAAFEYTTYVNARDPFAIYLHPQYLIPSVLGILWPLAFGYSIFKYKLMDAKLVIKKSLIYAIVTAIIAGLYIVIVVSTGSALSTFMSTKENQALSIIALLVAAFVFDPLKRVVQEWVDRVFYREKYNYQKALLDFSNSLPMQVDLKRILNSVVETVSSVMHIEKVAVVLSGDSGQATISCKNIPEEFCKFNGQAHGIRSILNATKEPLAISTIKEEYHSYNIDEKDYERLVNAGVELSVPMFYQDKMIGFINVGQKRSESIYSQEDINLLSTVASQTAIAVENSRLYEKEKTLFHINEELKLASQIQLEWLPKEAPNIPNYDISGRTQPAKVVGGDYFDYFSLGGNKLGVCIGDVSGKGLPAALLMANLQAIIRSQSLLSLEPEICVSRTNSILYDTSRSDMFVTLCYGILDYEENIFIYTNAGHNYPFLLNKNGGLSTLTTGGLVLGIKKDAKYESSQVMLEKGNVLVFFSDGITEEASPSEELFSDERLYELTKAYQSVSSEEIIEKAFEAVKSFAENDSQRDDMTMIVVRRV